MTKGKMERYYFEEKKELAIDGIQDAQSPSSDAVGLLGSWSYEAPNIVNASEVHEAIRHAKAILDNARRNFEKVRWVATATNLEFNDWIAEHGHHDLVI